MALLNQFGNPSSMNEVETKNSVEKFNIIELCDTATESFEAFYIEDDCWQTLLSNRTPN